MSRRSSPRRHLHESTLLLLAVAGPLLLNVVGPIAYIRHFRFRFGLSPEIEVLHGALAVSLTAVVLVPLLLLVNRAPEALRAGRARAAGVALALLNLFFLTVYASTWVSNLSWGDNLNLQILWAHLRHPTLLFAVSPYSQSMTVALAGAVGVSFAALGAVLARAYASWLPLLGSLAFGSSPARRAGQAAAAALVLLSVLHLGQVAFRSPWRFHTEPLTDFFGWPKASTLISMNPERYEASLEDELALAAYPLDQTFEERNVVLIIVDALRADRMSLYGYERSTTPHLEKFEERGFLHKVSLGLSTCSESYCGIASVFTSRPFHQISARSLQFPALLRKLGYRTHYIIAGEHRDWPYLAEFYGDDVDYYFDFEDSEGAFPTDDMVVLDGLRELPAFAGTPSFFYFFLMSSHPLGARYPQYEVYEPAKLAAASFLLNEVAGTRRVGGGLETAPPMSTAEIEAVSNFYDNGVLQVDAFIGRIFKALDRKGYMRDALVAIVSDHGEGLGEHGHFGHTRYLYQEDIRVPILFIDRSHEIYRNASFATHLDVAPTLFDRLGLEIPDTWAGRSLLEPPGVRQTLHQTRRGANLCRALVTRNEDGSVDKLLRCDARDGSREEEFYELTRDPNERRNLIESPELEAKLAPLRAQLDAVSVRTLNRCDRMECID